MSMKIGSNNTLMQNGTINASGKAKELAQMQSAAKDKVQKPAEDKTGGNQVSKPKNVVRQPADLKAAAAKPSAPQQVQQAPTAPNAANPVYSYNKVGAKIPIQAAGSAIDIIAK